MSRRSTCTIVSLWLLALALSGLTGCSSGTSEAAAYDPENHRGVTDSSLPADAQQRQAVVKAFLDALMPFNYHFEELPDALPGIRITETKALFLGDKLALFGWSFGGKPQGNDVPVIVYLAEDEKGRPAGKEERTYVVTGGPGGWMISRRK